MPFGLKLTSRSSVPQNSSDVDQWLNQDRNYFLKTAYLYPNLEQAKWKHKKLLVLIERHFSVSVLLPAALLAPLDLAWTPESVYSAAAWFEETMPDRLGMVDEV